MKNLLPFVLVFIVGAIFYLCGVLMLRYPPKKINYFYGYRTPSSMRTQERWEYAQHYSANLMKRLGSFLTRLSALGLISLSSFGLIDLMDGANGKIIATTAIIVAVICLIGQTEWSIYENFKTKR